METAGQIELLFGTASTTRLSHAVGIRVFLKRVLPSGTLSRILDLEKFRHSTSTVASVVSLVH